MPVAQRRAVPKPKARTARVARKTKETDIVVELGIDGAGKGAIDTGVPFFDHMLDAFSRHGFFDLSIAAKGDIAVDQHHTVEDVGLALGQAFKDALGDKAGIRRFGEAACPLDEALVRITVDLSGRPFLVYNVDIKRARVGNFDTELIHDFLLALVNQLGMNLHVDMVRGRNAHHIIEATFKAFARAMDFATQLDPRVEGVLSTKGSL
jgi:imidazoleglycerol-phosphate dehydratase